MKPLIILLTTFCIALLTGYLSTGDSPMIFAGNMAMCVMLLFTALGHFKFQRGMAMMMPDLFRFKMQIVFLSGVLEIIFGIMLLFSSTRFYAGVLLIAMFLLMIPANISAALRRVNYEKASYDGAGPEYLWFRIPLQLLFIAWVFYFSVR